MRAVNLLVVRPAAAALLIGVALVGGCYHTRSLGHVPGDEAIVEQETLGRTTRYLLDLDRDSDPSRIRARLLEVEGITERTRAAHERLEHIEITQSWPLPLGWFIHGETVRQTRNAAGLIYRKWSDPHERFDVRSRAGQVFEVLIDATPPRRVTANDDGWITLPRPKALPASVVIRTHTPQGRLEKTVELR